MNSAEFFSHIFFELFLNAFIYSLPSYGSSVKRVTEPQLKRFDIRINGYSPSEDDDYVAVSVRSEPGYIVKFEPFAHADRVHHMLLYGCTEPAYSRTNFWRGQATCGGSTHIIYAWARNAPDLQLPENVGFAVGNAGDPVQYLVLQIHYARKFSGNVKDFSGITLYMSEIPTKYFAGVYLFVSGEPIPPRQPAFLNNISCTYSSDTEIHPFAFRTHTHGMGRVVSAYFKHDGHWSQIGKRNPQWPQLFQLRDSVLTIRNGDFMAATCRFDSSDKDSPTPMGSMGVNEMCNFYMMFYRDAKSTDPFPYWSGCFGNENPDLVAQEYPREGITLLPPHPEWRHMAHQSEKSFGVLENEKITSLDGIRFGQIAGLAIDPNGNLAIFHRSHRIWDGSTFNMNNVLQNKNPIKSAAILLGQIDPKTNKLFLLNKYGKNLFYLPHGIFVDQSNDYYTTDVGSHQVIKWRIQNDELVQVWALGEKFVPGNDHRHFCKPAGIAVSKIDGSVFVADGYCNSRIVKISKDGEYLMEFGKPSPYDGSMPILGQFSLPHDISLDDSFNEIYVADRENGRVQVFTNSGDPIFEIRQPNLFTTLYSVHFNDEIGLVFAPGPPQYNVRSRGEINIFVAGRSSSHIQYSFSPTSGSFVMPHVLRASNKTVWIGEIVQRDGVLWRMEIQSGNTSSEKTNDNRNLPQNHQSPNYLQRIPLIEHNPDLQPNGLIIFLLVVLFLFVVGIVLLRIRCCNFGGKKTVGHKRFDKKGFKLLSTNDVEEMLSDEDVEINQSSQTFKNLTSMSK